MSAQQVTNEKTYPNHETPHSSDHNLAKNRLVKSMPRFVVIPLRDRRVVQTDNHRLCGKPEQPHE